jgi:hypothetical protein
MAVVGRRIGRSRFWVGTSRLLEHHATGTLETESTAVRSMLPEK